MKRKITFILFLTAGFLLFQSYNIFKGKKKAVIDKSNLRQNFIDTSVLITPQITYPTLYLHIVGTSITVRGQASGSIEKVQVRMDSGEWTDALGFSDWQYAFTSLGVGNHTVYSRIKYLARNSAENSVDFNMGRTYGTDLDEYSRFGQETADGGIMLGGYIRTPAGEYHCYMMKADSGGNTVWEKSFGSSAVWEYGYYGLQTRDGGYAMAGDYYPSDHYYFLRKLDGSGNLQWLRTYGSNYSSSTAYDMKQTADNGFILAGNTYTGSSNGMNIYLVRTGTNGLTNWTRTYGGTNYEIAHAVEQIWDGGYAICGTTESYGEFVASGYLYLIRTDANGNRIWTNTFGGAGSDYGWGMDVCSDKTFILVGETTSFGAGGRDVYLVKVNTNGALIWQKTFGGTGNEAGYSVRQTPDGGFIISGITTSYGAGDRDIYLIKTDAAGNAQWTRTFGGSSYESYNGSYDIVNRVRCTSDGGYIITGSTHSFGSGGNDIYLIKLNSSGY